MNEELKVIISAEVANLKKGVNDAKNQVNTFQQKVEKAKKSIAKDFKAIGDAATKGFKAVAAGVAVGITAILGMSAATEEYRNNQAKLITSFEAAGGSAETAGKTYKGLYRILGDDGQAVEAAQHLAKLTTNEEDLTEWTTICTGVYATFGDSLPIEGLAEAANETAKTGVVTGSLADALNWAGISEEEFNKKLAACNTEAEREQLIRETLNGTYGEAAAMYETNNAAILAQRDAQANLQATMASLGEAVAPIVTAFTTFANDVLAMLIPYVQELAENALPVLQEVLGTVAEALGKVIGWVIDNWELVSTIGTIILGVVGTLTVLSTAISAVSAVLTIATSPITLVIAGIAALVAAIVLCVKYWDEIKAKVVEVWGIIVNWVTQKADLIKAKVLGMVANVKQWFSDMGEKIKTAVSDAKEAAVEKFEEIKSNITEKVLSIKNNITTKFNEIKTSISTTINNVKSTITTIFSNIYNTITTKINNAKSKVESVFNSIKSTIEEKIEAAKKTVSDVIDKVKKLLGFDGFSWSLPKPKLPHFKISGGKAPWGFMGEGSLPKIAVEWYAKGGVFDAATLFAYGHGSIGGLGENGAEAIVPLENNLGWLDKLATMLDERMGNSSRPIILTVDGKVFAQTSIDSINALTRQQGSLGLNLV